MMERILDAAKFFAAVLGAGLIAAQQALPMSPEAHGWTAVGLAMATAVTVYWVPNKNPAP